MYIAIARHENIAAYKALRMAGIEPTEANMNRYIECEYLSFEIKADGKITEDELPSLRKIIDQLEKMAEVISEMKIAGEKYMNGK